MSKTKGVRVLVEQFLSATVDQIVEAVEKMISGYEEEMFQSKRKISRRRKMLDALLQPETRLNGTSEEAQLNLSVLEEDLLTEQQQEWNSCEVSVKHSLSVAAERIMEAVEKMVSGYNKGEMHQSRREISRQRKMINALLQPEIRLTRIPAPSAEEQMPIEADEEVPFPGFSEPESEDDDDWNATEDCNTPPKKKEEKITSCVVCKVCGRSFRYEGPFLRHLESHPKDECGLCGLHFKTEEDFELHLKTHKNEIAARKKVAVCDVCGKAFTASSRLEAHTRSHTGEKPFTCEVCGKSFASHKSMKNHHLSHTGERPFRCELCGKSFAVQDSLTRHHLIHAGENPYACTICSEHFIRYSTLRKHMRTHKVKRRITVITSTTPEYDNGHVDTEVITKDQLVRLVCKMCGKDFHSKVSLVNHLESHPKDDCGLCGMHFNTEEDFELHLKTHKDETAKVCDVCGKSFSKPLYLEEHMRGHMGEKRFKCSVCDKVFRQRSAMTDHLRIHTGEKPYSCTSCSKCFTSRRNLNQHMRRCRLITCASRARK